LAPGIAATPAFATSRSSSPEPELTPTAPHDLAADDDRQSALEIGQAPTSDEGELEVVPRLQTPCRGPTIGGGERLALRGLNGEELRAVHADEREKSPSVVDDGNTLWGAHGRGTLHCGLKDVQRPFMGEHQVRGGVCDRYPSRSDGRLEPPLGNPSDLSMSGATKPQAMSAGDPHHGLGNRAGVAEAPTAGVDGGEEVGHQPVEQLRLLEIQGVPTLGQDDEPRGQDGPLQHEVRLETAGVLVTDYEEGWTDGHDLDLDSFLAGNHTIYLYAPAHQQRLLRPLFETITQQVVAAAQERAALAPDGMLSPRLGLFLDEAGNCAALSDLDVLATTARGQGIQLVTVWHDKSQLEARYGPKASTILNNHRAKLFLSGLADLSALELGARLIGDQALVDRNRSMGSDGRHSLNESTQYRPLLPVEDLRRLRPGEGVLLYGHLRPTPIRLRPFYEPREQAAVIGRRTGRPGGWRGPSGALAARPNGRSSACSAGN
jgi:type IV secretory system conjugative DNA transfer VirD4/TraG family protein